MRTIHLERAFHLKRALPCALGALGILLFAGVPGGATPTLNGFPFADEDLAYSINWPSGLNLGEGHFRAHRQGSNWSFELTIDASVPGYDIKDSYQSTATPDFCSLSFQRTTVHGARKAQETETVSRSSGTAARVTANGGGKSEFAVPDCVKDALTLLYFTRRELGQGRVPPAQQFLNGALYRASFDYAGAPVIQVGGKSEQSDKLICTVTGPASNVKFEMYFARDAARTPLVIKTPLAMGSFTMELVR